MTLFLASASSLVILFSSLLVIGCKPYANSSELRETRAEQFRNNPYFDSEKAEAYRFKCTDEIFEAEALGFLRDCREYFGILHVQAIGVS
jgi:hypothetical protein